MDAHAPDAIHIPDGCCTIAQRSCTDDNSVDIVFLYSSTTLIVLPKLIVPFVVQNSCHTTVAAQHVYRVRVNVKYKRPRLIFIYIPGGRSFGIIYTPSSEGYLRWIWHFIWPVQMVISRWISQMDIHIQIDTPDRWISYSWWPSRKDSMICQME